MLNGAIASVETDFEWIELLRAKLLISLECRFDYVEKTDVLIASKFLDFRYKNLSFIVDEAQRCELKARAYRYLEELLEFLNKES